MPRKYSSMLERLEANAVEIVPHSDFEKPCRLWTGGTNSSGYGKLCIRTRRRDGDTGHRKTKHVGAHRMALAVAWGVKIWQLNYVTHKCDRRRCIEPTHLFSTTQKRNMRDMVARGRHGNATRAPVREKREEYA